MSDLEGLTRRLINRGYSEQQMYVNRTQEINLRRIDRK